MASPPAILDASGPSDHAAVRAALQDLAQQPAQLAVVDVRPRESFLQGPRLRGSCHVPGHDLAARCFLLPDHETRLGVVLPAGTDLPTQGCRTLPLFLHSHGWTQVAWCVRASPVREAPFACRRGGDEPSPCGRGPMPRASPRCRLRAGAMAAGGGVGRAGERGAWRRRRARAPSQSP